VRPCPDPRERSAPRYVGRSGVREVQSVWEGAGNGTHCSAEALRPTGWDEYTWQRPHRSSRLVEKMSSATAAIRRSRKPHRARRAIDDLSSELFRLAFDKIGEALWERTATATDDVNTLSFKAYEERRMN